MARAKSGAENSGAEHAAAVGKSRWRLPQAPPIEPEDSFLLRALTQAMVLVGIAATDVAASTEMSVWAIPLSIAGEKKNRESNKGKKKKIEEEYK